ncbi:MAG TPA: hypothetical protein VJH03_26055 [Blastocatellia bacterium]|nr:hypothetical protein [Blastocatellia bacterium]
MRRFARTVSIVILGCQVLWPAVTPCQTNEPALEFDSLLSLRFYEQTGGFLVDTLQLVFPPANDPPIEFVVTRGSGETVATVPLRIQRWQQFPAFAGLSPTGHTGVVQLGQPGDYVITVKLGGQAITRLPFTMNVDVSTDPFNPKKAFTREGQWRSLGYFSVPVDNPGDALSFNWWTCTRELPAGMSRPRCTVHVMRAGKEIAASDSAVVVSANDWQFFRSRLVQRTGNVVQNLTMAGLTSMDGEVRVVFKAEGRPIKSYTGQVRGGQLQRLDRCRLDTKPHTDFISPRLIDTSSRSGSRYRMLDAYWVKEAAR